MAQACGQKHQLHVLQLQVAFWTFSQPLPDSIIFCRSQKKSPATCTKGCQAKWSRLYVRKHLPMTWQVIVRKEKGQDSSASAWNAKWKHKVRKARCNVYESGLPTQLGWMRPEFKSDSEAGGCRGEANLHVKRSPLPAAVVVRLLIRNHSGGEGGRPPWKQCRADGSGSATLAWTLPCATLVV